MGDGRRFYEARPRASDGRLRPPCAIASRLPRSFASGCRHAGLVLEFASGTGEHVVSFRRALSVARMAAERSPSGRTRLRLPPGARARASPKRPAAAHHRCRGAEWPIDGADAVLSINMVHISPWNSALGLIAGAATAAGAGRAADPLRPVAAGGASSRRRATRRSTPTSNGAIPPWGLRLVEDFAAAAPSRGFELAVTRRCPPTI